MPLDADNTLTTNFHPTLSTFYVCPNCGEHYEVTDTPENGQSALCSAKGGCGASFIVALPEKTKVECTLGDLLEHYQLDRSLWVTPGSNRPYWSNNARYMFDRPVASPTDFLEAAGYTSFPDDLEDGDDLWLEVYSLEVYLLSPQ